jgi:hypothetical protein
LPRGDEGVTGGRGGDGGTTRSTVSARDESQHYYESNAISETEGRYFFVNEVNDV